LPLSMPPAAQPGAARWKVRHEEKQRRLSSSRRD
jgi:hypothetical protein